MITKQFISEFIREKKENTKVNKGMRRLPSISYEKVVRSNQKKMLEYLPLYAKSRDIEAMFASDERKFDICRSRWQNKFGRTIISCRN